MNTIPLERAVLCVDCSQLSQTQGSCPACGSWSLMSIAKVLDREEQGERCAPIPFRRLLEENYEHFTDRPGWTCSHRRD